MPPQLAEINTPIGICGVRMGGRESLPAAQNVVSLEGDRGT